MTEQEKAEKFAHSAPGLSKKELEEINNLFPTYIFRRSRTGEIWCSCCGRYEKHMNRFGDVFRAEHQREPRNMYEHSPKPSVNCPFCGKPAIVKELGRTGHRDNLCSWRRAVVLRWYRGALWGRAYDFKKEYGSEYNLTEKPRCNLMSVYRFRPGKAEETRRHGFFSDGPFIGITVQDHGLSGGKWKIGNPFPQNWEYGTAYSVLGMEEIQKSPFKYCMVEESRTCNLVRYLTACCFYPRKIEMLMKFKMEEVVSDLVNRGVKHATVIKWDDKDQKNPFGLNGQELRQFMDTSREIETLELYKKLKSKASIQQCDIWQSEIVNIKEIADLSNKWNIPMVKLIRYLDASKPRGYNITGTFGLLKDYIHAAQALGYPLYRENVLLPVPLRNAHDSVVDKHRNLLAEEAKKRLEKERKKDAEAYAARKKALEEKYGFTVDGITIRIPEGREEIIDEGRILQHCVAGYADRHVKGTVTILFMRHEKTPHNPWLTIEMRGNSLMQIHGYKNEGLYSCKGRFAPDPREEYKAFLDLWLEWLKRGSKRNKDGTPRIKQTKGKIA